MWIELPDEIENYICNISNSVCKASLAINNLLNSMIAGKHIVYLSRNLIDKLLDLEYIDRRNKDYYKWVKQHYISIYAISDIIEYSVKIVVDSDRVVLNGKCYQVPLEYFADCRETKLLTENETDGMFFVNIYHYIINHKNEWHTIKFENDSCHGSNVVSKIKQVADEKRFAICILDSDRDMKGSKIGDTYKGAKNVLKNKKNNYLVCLEDLKVREKENLFPPSIYKLFCEEKKDFLEVLTQFENDEKLVGFFDIKDGIKYKKYKIKGWEEYYEIVINSLQEKKIYKLPKSKDKYNGDFVCIEGIGDKLCDRIVNFMLENKCLLCGQNNKTVISKSNIKIIREKYKGRKFLPKYMLMEWKRISSLLFTFGCCINIDKKKPIYEIHN